MYRYRPFRNTDPPYLADIWCRQKPQRGMVHPISVSQFETHVFSKPYFDPRGLIVATRDDVPVGFVHAGFGPNDDESWIATEMGVVCRVMVHEAAASQSSPGTLAGELIARGEQYLRDRGARLLYAGGIRPLCPFYWGLYGGSELPGILDSDSWMQAVYRDACYEEIDQVLVLHRDLTTFRPIISRQQLAIRRSTQIAVQNDPPVRSWWQAVTEGSADRMRLQIVSNRSTSVLASTTFWNIEPLATSWGISAAGILDLESTESSRRQGYATFLLSEAFRRLRSEGVRLIEVQTMRHNEAARALYRRLGFVEVDRGAVLRKRGGS
ncbi:MAG: GNAT family N-acetyltransferase [Pirellulales bacterium]